MGIMAPATDGNPARESLDASKGAATTVSLDDSNGTAATARIDEDEASEEAFRGDDDFADFMKLIDKTPKVNPIAVADEVDAAHPAVVICEDDSGAIFADHGEETNPADHGDETHFRKHFIRDSIQVQMNRKVNADQGLQEKPHLEIHAQRPDGQAHSTREESATEEKSFAPLVLLTQPTTAPDESQGQVSRTEQTIAPEKPRGQAKSERKVHFGTVLVRDYEMILGDHPCCSYGPPLTIDWDYLEYEPLDVNEYEFHHQPRRCLREMGMNYYQRKKVLSEAGFTELDFKNSKKEINRTKLGRSITRQVASTPLSVAETAAESACRKFKRLIKKDHWQQQKQLYAPRAKALRI